MSSFVFRGVTFQVADKGGLGIKTVYGLEGARMNATYRVPWGERANAVYALLGDSMFTPGFSGGYIARNIPHSSGETGFTYTPTGPFCHRVEIEPEITRDPDGPLVNAEYALLRCEYRATLYDVREDTDPLVLDGAGEPDESLLKRYVSIAPPKDKSGVHNIPPGALRFVGFVPPRPVVGGTPIPYSDAERVYTWHQVPLENVPWVSIMATLNKSNSAVFDGHAVGTMVFHNYSAEPIVLPLGKRGVNMIYTFRMKAAGANFFRDPKQNYEFHEVEYAGGAKPFPPVDFAPLFRPVPAP